MKKIIYILAGVALTTTLMVGCSKASTENTQTAQSSQSASTENGSTNQKNFQGADLEGEVASIDGNKITLKVIKAPERPQGGDQKNAKQNGDQKHPQDSNNNNGQAPNKQGNRQVEYTGETKDITLSDGIQITTMSRGKQNSDSKTLTASDIKVGNTLLITYSDKDKETISKIAIKQAADKNGNADTSK
jgi:hypothetical protein